jgi:hypothetical protein
MAVTALYRKSSGEVVKISLQGQLFADRNTTYWGVITDPVLPDGHAVRATNPDGTMGPLRVFGYAKHYPLTGTTISNATQGQIDTYAAKEADDEQQQDADQVVILFETHPRWRKAFKALVKRIVGVTNDEKTQINAIRQALLDATSLADLKNLITAKLNKPTVEQALTALRSDISKDD